MVKGEVIANVDATDPEMDAGNRPLLANAMKPCGGRCDHRNASFTRAPW